MTPADLARIHVRAFPQERGWSEEEFATLLAQPGAVLSGDARAFALLRVVADEAEVLTIATDPDHRRKGHARAALAEAEAMAAAQGATAVFLEVAEDNTPAQELYAQAGYRQVGRRPNYYVPKNAAPVAALVLRKDLAPK